MSINVNNILKLIKECSLNELIEVMNELSKSMGYENCSQLISSTASSSEDSSNATKSDSDDSANTYTVQLTGVEASGKLAVIKLLKQRFFSEEGFSAINEKLASLPVVLKGGCTKEAAEAIKQEFTGKATIEIAVE